MIQLSLESVTAAFQQFVIFLERLNRSLLLFEFILVLVDNICEPLLYPAHLCLLLHLACLLVVAFSLRRTHLRSYCIASEISLTDDLHVKNLCLFLLMMHVGIHCHVLAFMEVRSLLE